MARVRIERGSEGPSYDPYGWTEVHFEKTDGTKVVLRSGGLGYDRLTVLEPGGKMTRIESFEDGENEATREFQRLTGFSPWETERIPDRLRAHRRKRMSRAEVEQEEAFLEWDRKMLANAI